MIINASGSDIITLWYFNGNLHRKQFKNGTWIFVSGDSYNMSLLERSLDSSSIIYRYDSMDDIYGKIHGIKIYINPSKISDIVYRIENSFGYKIKIYNADINPVMRFMTTRNLEFFKIKNLYDDDLFIPSTKIEVNGLNDITIDNRNIKGNISESVYNAINSSIVIIYNNYNGIFSRVLKRMEIDGYKIEYRVLKKRSFESYGRNVFKNETIHIKNKIMICSESFIYSESGLPGIYEISRVSGIPPETVSEITPGTAVSTVEEKRALQMGILIPLRKDDNEDPKNPKTLFEMDAGGLVLNPDPGVYKNVYEIDFTSMYPGIIIKYNLSPEGRGYLSKFLNDIFERRIFYKKIKNRSYIFYQRDKALKWLLLTSFGYTGYKNAKFGKIEIHEKITSAGREILSRSMRICEKNGFKVLHGIVDSLWIMGNGNINKVLEEIKDETRLEIIIDSHYKWLGFLPSVSGAGSANRYIGLRYDDTFKIRGVELRQKNAPGIVKKFQIEALNELKCDVEEIKNRKNNIESIKKYHMNFNNFDINDFMIEFTINKRQGEYKVKTMLSNFTTQIERSGIEIFPGMRVSGAVVDKKHNIIDENPSHIDKTFYKIMLMRSFKPIDYILSHS